ncbi:phage antirepressor KilAC domain-containing protein [Mycobacteroides abscessus]|uniref:phage antirepressor KilAC domain-containing protein n=1 Tax=Mycobacteroides abscessus TaxID=36809 RepID=UPI0009A838DA|nr:phage antirepressor KilAC domain-containing protein [Mycobacteroides abscessus]SKI67224.1 DNA-damage-inducible protein D [Mycobacteroides abscessus subsp. abscessus]
MTTHGDLDRTDAVYAGVSPFDAIKQVTADGREFWSARDLMPLMGYSAWRNFLVPIERAVVAAKSQIDDVTSNFVGYRKISATKPMEDFELSRFAAYLVAMNGDPNKPQVAAAQAYFAIRTREAEVAEVPVFQIPRTLPDALRLAADQAERAELAEARALQLDAKVQVDAPKVSAYERFMSAEGTYSVGTVAKILGRGQNKLFDDLRNRGVLITKGHMRNTPYEVYMKHFDVKPFELQRSDGTCSTRYVTKVRPSGIAFIARKLGELP